MKKVFFVLLIIPLAVACTPGGSDSLGPPPSDVIGGMANVARALGQSSAPPSKTTTLPPPSKLPAASPMPQQVPASAYATAEIPQAVPPEDNLTTIPGIREVYPVSRSITCYQMAKKFKEQGLRLELATVVDYNQPGRSGGVRQRSKRVPGKRDISPNRGRMVFCVFEGIDAIEGRYNFNDDFANAELEIPDYSQYRHPNDYRPDPNAPTEQRNLDRSNPNRRTVQEPDPADRAQEDDRYNDLPF